MPKITNFIIFHRGLLITCEDCSYFPLDGDDKWKVGMIKDIIDAKNDVLEVPGFEQDELETLLPHVCRD